MFQSGFCIDSAYIEGKYNQIVDCRNKAIEQSERGFVSIFIREVCGGTSVMPQ